MGISDLVDKIFLKPYLDEREETYYQARDLALILLAIAVLLCSAISFSSATFSEQLTLGGVIVLCFGVLIIIRAGLPNVATSVAWS